VLHNKIPNAPGGGTVVFVTEGGLNERDHVKQMLTGTLACSKNGMCTRIMLKSERKVAPLTSSEPCGTVLIITLETGLSLICPCFCAHRAGLVFRLKESVGYAAIEAKEDLYSRICVESLVCNPSIYLLGNPFASRLPFFSVMIRPKVPFIQTGTVQNSYHVLACFMHI